MPANLTAQYKAAEERYRKAVGHDEKLDALREMLALLPKHKGTEKLQGDLRRRIAKLEDEGAHVAKSGHRGPDPGHVPKEGAGQWALVGPPNAPGVEDAYDRYLEATEAYGGSFFFGGNPIASFAIRLKGRANTPPPPSAL